MNQEFKRKANRIIAEFDGWTFKRVLIGEMQISPDHKTYCKLACNQLDHFPNYCDDYRALHAVELKLPEYAKLIILGKFLDRIAGNELFWDLYTVNSDTRIELLLCTIGKWHEISELVPPNCPQCDTRLFRITSDNSKELGDWACPSCNGDQGEASVKYFWNWQLK